jgi:hypothetical protein
MKRLKILSLGIVIWVATWIWPEINELLTLQVMLASIVGLGLIILGRLFIQRQFYAIITEEPTGRSERSTRPPHDSHPIKPIGLA